MIDHVTILLSLWLRKKPRKTEKRKRWKFNGIFGATKRSKMSNCHDHIMCPNSQAALLSL